MRSYRVKAVALCVGVAHEFSRLADAVWSIMDSRWSAVKCHMVMQTLSRHFNNLCPNISIMMLHLYQDFNFNTLEQSHDSLSHVIKPMLIRKITCMDHASP